MDRNRRIEGIGHQVKGAVMESLGVAIGDAKLAADGSAERAIGDKLNSVDAGGEQLAGIDTDRIRGIGHQIKGAVIEAIGQSGWKSTNCRAMASRSGTRVRSRTSPAEIATWRARRSSERMWRSSRMRRPIRRTWEHGANGSRSPVDKQYL